MTMSPKQVRSHAAKRALEIALIRKHPDLSDGALEFLVAAGEKTIEWAEAVTTGEDFDVHACVFACETSPVGQLIFGEDDHSGGDVDHADKTKDMKPADQINYAREHGLK